MPRETNQSERNPIVTGEPADDDVIDSSEEDDELFEEDDEEEVDEDDEDVRDATAEVGSEGGSEGNTLERGRRRSGPPTGSEASETWKPLGYQPQVAEVRPAGYTVIKPAP